MGAMQNLLDNDSAAITAWQPEYREAVVMSL